MDSNSSTCSFMSYVCRSNEGKCVQYCKGGRILYRYLNTREPGLTEDRSKKIYEALPTLTLEDVKETQKKLVEGRTYHYGILGDIKDLDTEYLSTLGPVKILTLEDVFGY